MCHTLTGTTFPPPAHERWRTGDIFKEVPTEQGMFLEHKCREDDIILHTTGEMTNPLVTEDVILARCPFVRRVCVIGSMQVNA
jgi:long-subunit acyl-CoA synthetase (AMP-forming)